MYKRQALKRGSSSDLNLIEYGGDNAKSTDFDSSFEKNFGVIKGDYAFKVCRIVPENNIELILNVFSRSEKKLVLVGNWQVSDYSRMILERYSKFANLLLIGPIYEQDKIDSLRSNCKMYIHGHSVGGTNPSLVEAMSLGLCVACFDVSYNRETTENCALMFSNEFDLNEIVNKSWNSVDVLSSIGSSLQSIANKRYGWASIVDRYDSVFVHSLSR